MGQDETVDETVAHEPTRRSRRRRRPRRRVSVFGVIGELFLTAGVVVLMYVAWQMWIGDWIYGAQANAAGQSLSEEWAQSAPPVAPSEEPTEDGSDAEPAPAAVDPLILPAAADAETFASIQIPRFGADYNWEVAGGVTRARTLDTFRVGHYLDSAMPGEVGNFALAGHRTTYGAPFNRMAELHVGDAIVIEVREGWYTYRFRTLEYVTPDQVEVLLDVPQKPDIPETGERYLTMTSCSPMFSLAERIIGYGLFESFTPREAGPPASLEVPA